MASPINASLDQLFRNKITDVVIALSKRTTFYAVRLASPTQCPNCVWDAANRCSTGTYNGSGPKPFVNKICPVCNNVGKVGSTKQVKVNATVRWLKPDKQGNEFVAEGRVDKQFAKVKVLYSDRHQVEIANYFLVDGSRYSLVGTLTDRGLQSYVTTEFMIRLDA